MAEGFLPEETEYAVRNIPGNCPQYLLVFFWHFLKKKKKERQGTMFSWWVFFSYRQRCYSDIKNSVFYDFWSLSFLTGTELDNNFLKLHCGTIFFSGAELLFSTCRDKEGSVFEIGILFKTCRHNHKSSLLQNLSSTKVCLR